MLLSPGDAVASELARFVFIVLIFESAYSGEPLENEANLPLDTTQSLANLC